jgi:hypothetical protein
VLYSESKDISAQFEGGTDVFFWADWTFW